MPAPYPCLDCGTPVPDPHSLCAECGAAAITDGEAAATEYSEPDEPYPGAWV